MSLSGSTLSFLAQINNLSGKFIKIRRGSLAAPQKALLSPHPVQGGATPPGQGQYLVFTDSLTVYPTFLEAHEARGSLAPRSLEPPPTLPGLFAGALPKTSRSSPSTEMAPPFLCPVPRGPASWGADDASLSCLLVWDVPAAHVGASSTASGQLTLAVS